MTRISLSSLGVLFLFCASSLRAEDPCVSGLQPGQRPGPYAAFVSTGANRGQSHCFICETENRPAVVVFARTMSDPLGKLTKDIDRVLLKHKDSQMRAWVTFLSKDQVVFDPQVVKWGKKHGISGVPLGVFEDMDGPPSYRLTREADVTVLLFVKQKVVRNFAFREGELTDKQIAEVVKAVPEIIESTPMTKTP